MPGAQSADAVEQFLHCATPRAWVTAAMDNPALLLVDHANCEKKAASTALNLMYRYVEHPALLHRLSRLAREELRHFEQVIAIMVEHRIDYPQLSASRYAGELRRLVRTSEPARLVDTLVAGAVIEARSCERFASLASHLGTDEGRDAMGSPGLASQLAEFYRSLLKSEARHFKDYLSLARQFAPRGELETRVGLFLDLEQTLIESGDDEFRFHSGVPGQAA